MSTSALWWYRIDELASLFDNKVVEGDVIENRKKSFVQTSQRYGGETIVGEEAKKLIQLIIKEWGGGKEIYGTIANRSSKPVVKGIVKLVDLNYGNMESLEQIAETIDSEVIIVAQSTGPELMETLKKASAIVTDVGGMLSHAAIVSREFDIPCIVGTVHATKALKDGDEVEVDAERGIVKILKRARE